MPPAPSLRNMLRDRWVLSAAVAVTGAQLLYAFFADPVFNADGYVELGRDFAHYWQTNHLADTMRTPGYPLFLSSMYESGLGDAGIKVAQGAIVSAALLGLAGIAELVRGRRAARFCAWMFVLYIPIWSFSAIARTEAISIAILVFAALAVLLSEREGHDRVSWVLVATSLCALAVMVRPNSLPAIIVLLAVLATLALRREGLRGVAIVAMLAVLPFVALFGPWMARNISYTGDPEPLGHNHFPLALGTHLPYDGAIGKFASFERSDRFFSGQRPDGFTPEIALTVDPWQELRTNFNDRTKEFLRSRAVSVFQQWFWPETPRTGYGQESVVPYPLLMGLHLVVLFGGLAGLVYLRRSPVGAIGLGIFAVLFTIHLLYLALPRYALMVFPFLLVGASTLLAHVYESRSNGQTLRDTR